MENRFGPWIIARLCLNSWISMAICSLKTHVTVGYGPVVKSLFWQLIILARICIVLRCLFTRVLKFEIAFIFVQLLTILIVDGRTWIDLMIQSIWYRRTSWNMVMTYWQLLHWLMLKLWWLSILICILTILVPKKLSFGLLRACTYFVSLCSHFEHLLAYLWVFLAGFILKLILLHTGFLAWVTCLGSMYWAGIHASVY